MPPTSRAEGAALATFTELFAPKLITVLREGYGPAQLRDDALAIFTFSHEAV